MNRRYTDADTLANDMFENPGFYGISVYRQNPCCAKDQARVELAHGILDAYYEDAEDAVVYTQALSTAIALFISNFRENGIIDTGGPCESCLEAGDVDPAWLMAHPDAVGPGRIVCDTCGTIAEGESATGLFTCNDCVHQDDAAILGPLEEMTWG
jgi:hypothetical protein